MAAISKNGADMQTTCDSSQEILLDTVMLDHFRACEGEEELGTIENLLCHDHSMFRRRHRTLAVPTILCPRFLLDSRT